jgi:5'-nucleotidase
VSGVAFDFDPQQPPGSRVVTGSVFVKGEPLCAGRNYRLATVSFLALGKDGFDALKDLKVSTAPLQ